MSRAKALDRRVEAVLHGRLDQLRRNSGLPVVLAGTASRGPRGRRLRITALSGTIGRALHGLEITAGRGMGGIVVSRANLCRVDEYASATAITHDYDHLIVGQEQIHSMFAVPVIVDGAVRCVIYGATRDTQPIGDIALRMAGQVAMSTAKDLEELPAPTEPADADSAVSSGLAQARNERAVQELTSLTETVEDSALRNRLTKILSDLGGRTRYGPTARDEARASAALAPRELDALRLVEIGASNAAIAEELGLSLQTVKTYLSSAMRKLEAPNRTTAVHTARLRGLL